MTRATLGPSGKAGAQGGLGPWGKPQIGPQTPLELAIAVCVAEGRAGFPTFQSLGLLICKMGA